jgi:uncharacterized cupredoxin-like copper-binding protein
MGRCRLFLLVALAVSATACGADAEVLPNDVDSVDLVVSMEEWRFDPEAAIVGSGGPATVQLRNTGGVLHEWALIDGRVETESDLRGVTVLASAAVRAGGSVRIDLPVLDPGEYQVVCPIPGHISNGMLGTLTVRP